MVYLINIKNFKISSIYQPFYPVIVIMEQIKNVQLIPENTPEMYRQS
jgi:hypothetical protein